MTFCFEFRRLKEAKHGVMRTCVGVCVCVKIDNKKMEQIQKWLLFAHFSSFFSSSLVSLQFQTMRMNIFVCMCWLLILNDIAPRDFNIIFTNKKIYSANTRPDSPHDRTIDRFQYFLIEQIFFYWNFVCYWLIVTVIWAINLCCAIIIIAIIRSP